MEINEHRCWWIEISILNEKHLLLIDMFDEFIIFDVEKKTASVFSFLHFRT